MTPDAIGRRQLTRLRDAGLGPNPVTIGNDVTAIMRAGTERLSAEIGTCVWRTYRAICATP